MQSQTATKQPSDTSDVLWLIAAIITLGLLWNLGAWMLGVIGVIDRSDHLCRRSAEVQVQNDVQELNRMSGGGYGLSTQERWADDAKREQCG